jgi:GH18 family chitinase
VEALEARRLLAGTAASAIGSSPTLSAQVVGYLPDYKFNDLSSIDLSALTRINYFSIVANSDGSLPATSEDGASLSNLQSVVSAAHAASPPVAVSITINPQTPFLTIAQSATYTANFVNNLISFCAEYNLDGIDLDFEPGKLTASQQTAYGNLVAAIHAQTSTDGLILSAAVQTSQKVIPVSDIPDIDYYYVMDYDLEYNSSAPYSDSIAYLTDWANYGVPKSQLLLGVPFYGRSGASWSTSSTSPYCSIVSSDYADNGVYPDPSLDTVTVSGTTWGFNGLDTVEEKAQYVLQNGYAGIMIWSLGQDYLPNGQASQYSLLSAIKSVVDLSVTVPPMVTEVSSITAAGIYGSGTVIPITVTFGEAVTITGTPQLTLNAGSGATADYTGGSGTSTLTFA